MNLSTELKKRRLENKWTQKQTAEFIGISRGFYSDLENGKSKPSYDTLMKINKVFPFFLNTNDAFREYEEVS